MKPEMNRMAATRGLYGDLPVVQWLRFHPSTAGGTGLIPGQGTKIPHATSCDLLKKMQKMV